MLRESHVVLSPTPFRANKFGSGAISCAESLEGSASIATGPKRGAAKKRWKSKALVANSWLNPKKSATSFAGQTPGDSSDPAEVLLPRPSLTRRSRLQRAVCHTCLGDANTVNGCGGR